MAEDKNTDQDDVFVVEENTAEKEKSPEKEDHDKLEALEKELLYLRAEFDNYRKQTIKERSSLIKYAGEGLARDLLSVLDVFDKALENEVHEQNLKSFVDGVKLTQKELESLMGKHGIKAIQTKGQSFDPNQAEALSQIPSPNHKEGEVIEEMRKGYLFHDKVLRHAQVVIATQPQSDGN